MMTRLVGKSNVAEDGQPDVRIVLIGDHGVGKTSLIISLLEDRFCENVPSKIDDVIIPADVTPDHVVTLIHDYCASEQTSCELEREIAQANVICIVYSVLDQESIDKVTSYWLPLVKRIISSGNNIRPVILIGNKSDDADFSTHMEKVYPIMNEYEEIDTCIECSAKTMRNVSETFYFAQKAVLYPSHPLYLPHERELTKKCKRALIRIFKLCDNDNDGLLNDEELNIFQMYVFGVPLNASAIADVKATVGAGDKDGIIDNSLSLDGFIYLHQLFINRGRQETTWKILRRFGYDNELELAVDYLHPQLGIGKGCSTELTQQGFSFIKSLFDKYDEDNDGSLSPSEVQNLFSLCGTHSWNRDFYSSVVTNNRGWLTYHGFVCFWIMTAFSNVSLTMELLAYLGFCVEHKSLLEAIQVHRDRRIDIAEKTTKRSVFQCHVIGPKGAGKSVFLQSFIGHTLMDIAAMNRRKKHHVPYVLNKVTVKGENKYLLLHEVDVLSRDETLTSYEKSADVIVLLYDASDPCSFSYVATIYLKYFYRTKVPCVIVATKMEHFVCDQDYGQQPGEFCRNHALPQPIYFLKEDIGRSNASVYVQTATMAVYPHLKKVYYLHDSSLLSRVTFGAAVAALAGFLLYKNI